MRTKILDCARVTRRLKSARAELECGNEAWAAENAAMALLLLCRGNEDQARRYLAGAVEFE